MRTLLSLFMLALASGCCTEAGCVGNLDLTLPVEVVDGSYTLEVSLGSSTETLSWEIVDGAVVELSDTGLTASTTVSLSSGGLVASVDVGMDKEPESVTARLLRDDELVLEGEATPTWGDPFLPNGSKRCGFCLAGSATLEP